MPNFIHLRVSSDYSLGLGGSKVKDLVKHAAKMGFPALCLADHGNLFASLEFSLKCLECGVQPIVGSVVKVNFEEGKTFNIQKEYDELLLIAKNNKGYLNLLKVVSEAYLNSENITTPHVNFSYLSQYSEGLIILCGGEKSPVVRLLQEGMIESAKECLTNIKKLSGAELYIEIIRDGSYEDQYEDLLLSFAIELDIPIVATNDVQFLTPDMHEAHDALLCIANGTLLADDVRMRSNSQRYMKSPAEMQELFHDLPEAIINTVNIAKKCIIFSERRGPLLPNFAQDSETSEEDILKEMSQAGLARRLQGLGYQVDQQEYQKRLDYELSVINSMRFSGYFLIVSDFIKWSKAQGIPVGPGRGSGAGSLVAWCLEITDLDPIRFGLLFERFLNPDRVSMPDFDIDFCQERRGEVIEYVRFRYGEKRVAQIITFGKLQARAVLRDVGRVLGMDYISVDKICKAVPTNPANPITLKEAINLDKELQLSRESDQVIAKLLSISLQLEGMNRHASTHAAGIVIADRDLVELVPLYKDRDTDMPAVQYSMKYAEEAGLVKFDFLGLKTLTMIESASQLVRKRHLPNFNISNLTLDDENTYHALSKGDTVGIFQFESPGMKETIKKMRPDRIEDLIALGSLYRPGPMENIPSYINRKHGLEKPKYLYPLLEKILEETYGIIVYQEQVILIAQALAGYTLGEADLLRRAMGKKIKSEMEAQKDIFIQGCVKQGHPQKIGEEIFDLIEKFASYGFNKSHAAAYAIISYQTAYLKANYPLEFFTAAINLEIDDPDKINLFISDAKCHDIEVLPPSINRSEAMFYIEKGKIRFGMQAIKNVSVKLVEEIIKIRKRDGDFTDLNDFITRVGSKFINKRMLESMSKAGVFDEFGLHRRLIYENVEAILRQVTNFDDNKDSRQISLFDLVEDEKARLVLVNVGPWGYHEQLASEFQAFGFYFSSHPVVHYLPQLCKKQGLVFANEMESAIGTRSRKINIVGVITAKRIRSSKRGKYAFIQISDHTGIIDISIFDDKLLYEHNKRGDLDIGKLIYTLADARVDDNGLRIVVEKIIPIEEAVKNIKTTAKLIIHDPNMLSEIKEIIASEGIEIKLAVKLPEGGEVEFKSKRPIYLSREGLRTLSNHEKIELSFL